MDLRATQKQEEVGTLYSCLSIHILLRHKNNNDHTHTNQKLVSTFIIEVYSELRYVYLKNMTIPAYYSKIRRVRVVKQINKHLIL